MSNDDGPDRPAPLRVRKEPPPLVPVVVEARRELSPRLLRLTFAGEGIHTMAADTAASVRLLVPTPGTTALVVPEWNGNEFLLPDDTRPALRTFTPLDVGDGTPDRLDLEIVRHRGGAVSEWAERATSGDPAAISGPGRGFDLDSSTAALRVFGDETALPAIRQILDRLTHLAIDVQIEVVDDAAVIDLPDHAEATITWLVADEGDRPGARLVEAAQQVEQIGPTEHVWAAGEAAMVQAIRNHLFKAVGIPRGQATIRGYWKPASA